MRFEEKNFGRGTTALATTGTVLGGTSLLANLLNGGLGNILGGNSEKDIEIAYLRGRDAAKTDTLETYKYIDGELTKIREKQALQDVKNAQIEGTFAVLGEQTKAMKNEFMCALNRERDERCYGDNAIVNYANATFYPKMVADVTVGTTTTAQATYNPLPDCGRKCC